MEIDESKSKALTRFKKGVPVPSDHNYLHCTFNIPVLKQKPPRKEVYCLRSKTSLKIFLEKTSNTREFSSCFTKDGDIQKEGKIWLKTLQKTICSCFKKVRVRKQQNDHVQKKLSTRINLKLDINRAKTSKEKHELEDKLQRLEGRGRNISRLQ